MAVAAIVIPRRSRDWAVAALAAVAILVAGCASSSKRSPSGSSYDRGPASKKDGRAARGRTESGKASWYGPQFDGRLTANGEVFDMNKVSAAHKTLPFETKVLVENLSNGRELVVRINDRGPFIRGRIIDLSLGAARELDMVEAGVVPVRVTVLSSGAGLPQYTSTDFYRIQIGAFRDKKNARELKAELEHRYERVEIRSDGRWHRVQIRRLRDRSEADKMVEKLLGEGYDAFLSACRNDQCA